jgi:hypothetical protein
MHISAYNTALAAPRCECVPRSGASCLANQPEPARDSDTIVVLQIIAEMQLRRCMLASACVAFVLAACLVAGEAAHATGPATRQDLENAAPNGGRELKGLLWGTNTRAYRRSSTPTTFQTYTLSFQVQSGLAGPLTAPSSNTTQNSTQQKAFMDNLRTDLLSSKLGSYISDIQVNKPTCMDGGTCQDNMVQVYVATYVKCSNVGSLNQAITAANPISLLTPRTTSTYGLQSMLVTPSPGNADVKQQNCGSTWFGTLSTNELIGLVVGVVAAVSLVGYGIVCFVRWRRQRAAQAVGQPPITGSPAAPSAAAATPGYPYTPGQDTGLHVGTVAYITPGAAPQAPKVDAYPHPQPATSPVPSYPQYGSTPAPAPYPNMYASTAPAYPAVPEQDPYTAAAAAMRAELAAGGAYTAAGQPTTVTPPSDAPVSAGAVTYYKGWGQ